MVDSASLGRTGEPFTMDIERGKIAEFARATFAEHSNVSPPTFLMTAEFWRHGEADPWPAVAMDVARGLHAEQEFTFFGEPPRAGDRLIGQSRIEQIYTKQSRRGGTLTFAVMVTEFRDEAGRLVAEVRQTGVETS